MDGPVYLGRSQSFRPLYLGSAYQEGFREFPIKWRRYGVGVPPYWEGEFRGETEFSIKPLLTDWYIRVDLKSDIADVGVNITHRTMGLILIDKQGFSVSANGRLAPVSGAGGQDE